MHLQDNHSYNDILFNTKFNLIFKNKKITLMDGCCFLMQFGHIQSALRCSISLPICRVMFTHFPWNHSSHLSQQIMKRLLCGVRHIHQRLKLKREKRNEKKIVMRRSNYDEISCFFPIVHDF